MDATAEETARRAAQRLIGIDTNLPAMVEAQLRSGGAPPERYYEAGTLIALAGLVLNVAKFAWDIYRDMTKENSSPARSAVERRVRLEPKLELPPRVTEAQRDLVIAAVVAELPM